MTTTDTLHRAPQVDLTIDGQPVRVPAGTIVFDAARMNGIAIPTLCHQQNETPVGVCRLCVVDAGGRVLSASCVRPAEAGMKVTTNSEKVLARAQNAARTADGRSSVALRAPAEIRRLRTGNAGAGRRHHATAIRHAAPSRAARTIPRWPSPSITTPASCATAAFAAATKSRHNFVLGRMGKGYAAGIAFDLNSPMGDSTCVSCGECMVSCPTGALTNKSVVGTAIAAGPGAHGLEAEELHHLPVFKGVSGTFLELNRGAIVKRHFRAGEIICREGEFGSTAFYIVEGKAQVSISTPIAHVKTQGGAKGFFKRLTSTPGGAAKSTNAKAKPATAPFPSTLPSISPTTIPSPNSVPAICSAK